MFKWIKNLFTETVPELEFSKKKPETFTINKGVKGLLDRLTNFGFVESGTITSEHSVYKTYIYKDSTVMFQIDKQTGDILRIYQSITENNKVALFHKLTETNRFDDGELESARSGIAELIVLAKDDKYIVEKLERIRSQIARYIVRKKFD